MIVHCWVKAVAVLLWSMDPEQILYIDINVIFSPSLPCSVLYDHLPRPWISLPLLIYRNLMIFSTMMAVPLGLYVKSQFKVISEVDTVAPFQYFTMVLRNESIALFFFQLVFVSESNWIFILLLIILVNNSVKRWALEHRSSPFGLTKIIFIDHMSCSFISFQNDRFLFSSFIYLILYYIVDLCALGLEDLCVNLLFSLFSNSILFFNCLNYLFTNYFIDYVCWPS